MTRPISILKNTAFIAIGMSMTMQAQASFLDRLEKLQKSLEANNAGTQTQPPTSSNEVAQAPEPNLGYWTDPHTGLTWSRCQLGASWVNDGCSNAYNKVYSWSEAMLKANELTLFGFDDWRIPTVQELNSAFYSRGENYKGCTNKPVFDLVNKDAPVFMGCGGDVIGPRDVFFESTYETFWTSTPGQDPTRTVLTLKTNSTQNGGIGEIDRIRSTNPSVKQPSPRQLRAFVVRGGPSNGVFESSIELAKQDIQSLSQQAQDVANAEQKQKDAKLKEAQDRSRQYMATTENLRRSLKPGDRVKDGMVLEIKGNLVKVQKYGKQCKTIFTTNTGQQVCQVWHTVVTGEEWVRRDQIMAP